MELSCFMDLDSASEWLIVSAGAGAKEHLAYVQEAGDFLARGNYFTAREDLPSYLIKYTLSGEGRISYEGREEAVSRGRFFWIDCRKRQEYRTASPDGSWHVLWVHFYGGASEYLYRLFREANGGRCTGVLLPDSPAEKDLRGLLALYRGAPGPDADVDASALLADLAACCIRAAGEQPPAFPPEYVRRAREYLVTHTAEPVTLDTLAGVVSVNKFYLQKLFRKYTGQSPSVFLSQLRISAAKELLRTTEKPVSAIAAETGLENVSYFIRLFRKQEGITPAQYRKLWRQRV